MMGRVFRASALVLGGIGLSVAIATAQQTGQTKPQGRQVANGWNVPQGAADEKNPLTVSDAVIAGGKKIYGSKCRRCHGPEGKGNGPDADPMHMKDMNLTLAERAARNPDGVVFYKVWNGRTSPKMPKFSEELTKEQAWAVVAYVQTLRAKP